MIILALAFVPIQPNDNPNNDRSEQHTCTDSLVGNEPIPDSSKNRREDERDHDSKWSGACDDQFDDEGDEI